MQDEQVPVPLSPREVGNVIKKEEVSKESPEYVELLKEDGAFVRTDLPYELDQEFNKAIDEGLDTLDDWQYADDKKLRIWVQIVDTEQAKADINNKSLEAHSTITRSADDENDIEITVGDLRRFVLSMRSSRNPLGRGDPFRFHIVWATHTIEQEEVLDDQYLAGQKVRVLENLQKFEDSEVLWYAIQKDPYDPLSFAAVKSLSMREIRSKVEDEEGEFADWWGLQIISNDPLFNSKAYMQELAAVKEIRRKALELLKDLSEEDIITVQFSADRESADIPVSSVRWRIQTMDKEECKELLPFLEKRGVINTQKLLEKK